MVHLNVESGVEQGVVLQLQPRVLLVARQLERLVKKVVGR